MKIDEKLYFYKVEGLVGAHDGDSLRLQISVGFHMTTVIAARLEGIDTPELGTEGALPARDYLRSRLERALKDERSVVVRTYKTEKFGRWLARIYIGSECLNDTMLEMGLGRPYDGGKR